MNSAIATSATTTTATAGRQLRSQIRERFSKKFEEGLPNGKQLYEMVVAARG